MTNLLLKLKLQRACSAFVRIVAYLGERNRSHEAVVKGDEPVLEVERPRVEPYQFGVQLERRKEVERAAVADDGGMLKYGDAVAVAHVT